MFFLFGVYFIKRRRDGGFSFIDIECSAEGVMKSRQTTLLVFCFLLTLSAAGLAADKKLGFGIPAENHLGKSISVKYFPFQAYGLQTIYSFENNINQNAFFKDGRKDWEVRLRGLYRIVTKPHFSLYTGVGVGFGKDGTDSLDKTANSTSFQQTNSHRTDLLLGVEYFLKEIKNLGFSAEIGFSFEKQKESSSGGASASQNSRRLFSPLFGLHLYGYNI